MENKNVVVPIQVRSFANAFKKCKGNQTLIAKELGISRMTVHRQLKIYSKRFPALFEETTPLKEVRDALELIVIELSKFAFVPNEILVELREKLKNIY